MRRYAIKPSLGLAAVLSLLIGCGGSGAGPELPEGAGTAPQASFRHLPEEGEAPLQVSFDASASEGDAPLSFAWDFGDGSVGEGVRVSHSYGSAGRYEVALVVRDSEGDKGTARATVEVRGGEDSGEEDGDDGDGDDQVHGGARITLFNGQNSSQWRLERGGAVNWPIVDGALEVKPGSKVGVNDIRTRETFRDFRLHLEFRVPKTPSGTPEQDRGNSGVYLQGRYEVQVLDSYGRALQGKDDAGALYGIKNAGRNASRPPGSWQSYDVTFRAARWSGGQKVRDARVTVRWNGVLVHDGVRLPKSTRLGAPEGPSAGPITLQDHGDRVRYRNIWIEPLE